jgi:tetratricopeptide (TPR) repeat protein
MQPNPPDSTANASPASLLGRLSALAARPRAALGWLAASRRRLVLAGAAGLGLLAAIAAIVMFRSRAPATAPVTLPMALAALDRGNDAEAKQMAEKLRQQGDLSTEEWGGPDFVLGMVAVHQAQLALDKQKTAAYRTAAEYLQNAHDRGFPDGRQAVGLYWLGESLYLSGRISASRPIFQAVLKASPAYRTEVHRRLADAWLNESPPALEKSAGQDGGAQSSRPGSHPGAAAALDKALAENEQLLAAAELPAAERNEALVQRAQILFRLNRLRECSAILDRIPARGGAAGEVAVLRGRMLYREAEALAAAGPDPENRRKAREKYQAAIDALRLAQQRDTIDNRATRQAMVLTALCLLGQDQRLAACTLLDRTSKLFAGTPEGTAAAFHQAQQARRMGNDQAALAAYRRLLADISGTPEFHNPWISLGQVQAEVTAACQAYLAANRYELALGLSRLLAPPLVSKVRALEMRAEAHQAWGQSLLVAADAQPRERAETLRRQGRLQLRLAGGVYTELARRELASRLYPEQVWKAAIAYSQGQDYPAAVRLLRLYLQNESRKRHAQGLVELGEALLALGEYPRALEALGRCLEQYPRDAVSYRARLLAGRAAAVQGDLTQAEAFLRANLDGQSLTPASKEWRDSLFALGQLLAEQGRWAEAMRRLEEAVTRYGDAPQAIEARYLIAVSACRAAMALREPAGAGPRPRREAEAKPLWEKAVAAYRGVRDALAGRDPQELSGAEQAMLRNCRFALGEVYAALGRHEEAVAAYTEAANAYPDRPEVLEAYVSLAKVYRGMDRAGQARTSLEQARLALARIPGNARFDETTNYSRTQWNAVLDWMTSL